MAPMVRPARLAISWTRAPSYPFSENTSAAAATRRSPISSRSCSRASVTADRLRGPVQEVLEARRQVATDHQLLEDADADLVAPRRPAQRLDVQVLQSHRIEVVQL